VNALGITLNVHIFGCNIYQKSSLLAAHKFNIVVRVSIMGLSFSLDVGFPIVSHLRLLAFPDNICPHLGNIASAPTYATSYSGFTSSISSMFGTRSCSFS
jgi:hypothetical protein